MNIHPDEDRLTELVDGTLTAAEQASTEAHLVACDECRAALAALRSLIDELHSLPRDIKPQRDLRPAIWAQVDASPGTDVSLAAVGGPQADVQAPPVSAVRDGVADPSPAVIVLPRRAAPRTLASSSGWLAAAAVALIAVSSTVTWLIVSPAAQVSDGIGADVAVTSPATAAEVQALEARYVLATQELEQLLEVQRSQLPPETVGILEENLRIIDRALAEAAAALAGQPGNADLSRILVATWEKKLGLLRTATALEVGI